MTNSEHLGDEAGKDDYIPEPLTNNECTPPAESPDTPSTRSITFRGIVLALILNVIYTTINAYLGMNFGFGLGFGIITVLAAYTLFHITRGGSNRQEIATTMIASTGFVVYYILTISIYVQAYTPYTLPWWLVPPQDVLLSGSPFDPRWIPPIIFHIGFVWLGTILGFLGALAVTDYVQSRKQTKFPFYTASGVTINTCMETGQQSRFMFRWLGIGIFVTVLQYFINVLVMPFGLTSLGWDFTPFLLPGFGLGFMLNISLMAISYIIDPKVSITMLFAGIITYLVISPILVSIGLVTPAFTGMDLYFNLLFEYMLAPALGIMLLSGIVVFVISKIRKGSKSPEETTQQNPTNEEGNVGFGTYVKTYFLGLIHNRRLGLAYLVMMIIFIIIIIALNVFSAFPIWITIIIGIILLLPIALIDTFVLVKFVGEAGIGMGVQRLAFYEIPLTVIGLQGYTAFLAYPCINPFTTTDTLGNIKIGEMTETPRRSILIAQLIKIFPGTIVSVVFVLTAWYLIGFPNEIFPAVGVLQGYAIVSLFALNALATGFNIVAFFAAGILVGLLAVAFPISSLGVALAIFLPPSYFIPFSIGGFIRLFTDSRFGKEWFAKKGQVIAVGFIAGSAITLVIVSFLNSFLQLIALPICLALLGVILWRNRKDPSPMTDKSSEVEPEISQKETTN
ncbi:MAG: OPT/YSL family transporter [Candidatus Thorarchaeota archaeon]